MSLLRREPDGPYLCPSCSRDLVPTPCTMNFRGRSFAGLVCRSCTAIWDNPEDSMLDAAVTFTLNGADLPRVAGDFNVNPPGLKDL